MTVNLISSTISAFITKNDVLGRLSVFRPYRAGHGEVWSLGKLPSGTLPLSQ